MKSLMLTHKDRAFRAAFVAIVVVCFGIEIWTAETARATSPHGLYADPAASCIPSPSPWWSPTPYPSWSPYPYPSWSDNPWPNPSWSDEPWPNPSWSDEPWPYPSWSPYPSPSWTYCAQ